MKKIIAFLASILMCVSVSAVTGIENVKVADEPVLSNPATVTPFCSTYQDWLHYDDGTCENTLGLTNGGVLHEVIKLTPTELGAYSNHWFTNIKVMHGWPGGAPQPANDYQVWMYKGENHPTDPLTEGTIVGTGTSPATNDFVDIDITNYPFSPTDTVWIGVAWTHAAGNLPCGFDEDTNIPEKGGWLFYGTTWNQLHIVGYPGAWNLWVQVESMNMPPETPGAPSGPSSGVTGVEYTFTASTTDPEGDPIEYWFDWGDGTNSGWVGIGSAQHAWTTTGTYDVKVKAKDVVSQEETAYSPPHTIVILSGAVIKITAIKSGFLKIKVLINNTGVTEATNVQWSISLTGGALIGKSSSGTIASIPADGSVEVSSKLILGFGNTIIKVDANVSDSSDSQTLNGRIYFFYIKVDAEKG